jgi:aryl-alcohol dehydrogenase-like predicted oxidoreductase
MQNHYNLIYREEEREMIPQCIDQGVGVMLQEYARVA